MKLALAAWALAWSWAADALVDGSHANLDEILADQPELHCDTTNAVRVNMTKRARARLEDLYFSIEPGYFGFNGTGAGTNPAAGNPSSSCA